MKKLLTIVAAVMLAASPAWAQFGVIGGFTSSKTSVNTQDIMNNLQNVSLFHAGVAYRIPIGSYFAVQPALTYEMKGANLGQVVAGTQTMSVQSKTGFIQLSAGLQAGFDLLAFQPFLLFEPFVGYAVTGTEKFEGGSITSDTINNSVQQVKNKLEWGFGVGGGVHVLNHIQLTVQWFMNLGTLYNQDQFNGDAALALVKENYKDIRNYQGIKVSLGYFF